MASTFDPGEPHTRNEVGERLQNCVTENLKWPTTITRIRLAQMHRPYLLLFRRMSRSSRNFCAVSHPAPTKLRISPKRPFYALCKLKRPAKFASPEPFCSGLPKNVARKELEKKSRSIIDFIEDFGGQEYISNEAAVDDCVDSRQRMLVFWEAVATLPPQCQKVFVLKKVYGYSHKEIARKLGISISTIEKHAAAGLKRCSDYMDRASDNAVSGPTTVTQARPGRSEEKA